jgi:exopolysaccharide biosynthesis polyprenyl glycosylphosphotransferase
LIRESVAPGHLEQVATRRADEASLGLALDKEGASSLRIIRWADLALVAMDAGCAVVAMLAFRGMTAGGSPLHHVMLHLAVSAAIWVGIFHVFGLHRVRYLSALHEFRGTVGAAAVGLVVLLVTTSGPELSSVRPALAWTALLVLALELLGRRAFRWLLTRMAREGRLALRTALVGANGEAGRLARALGRAGQGFAPVGYVAVEGVDPDGDGLPLIGDIEALEDVIRRHRIECVFVAGTAASTGDMLKVSQACRRMGVEMRVSANLPDALPSRMSVQRIGDFAALGLKTVRLTKLQEALKRIFDVVVASLALVAAFPFLLVMAAAIRLTSKGPALFRQTRVTKDGRPFRMYKFRTMVEDSERALDGIVIDLTQAFFKLQDDPRLTSVGRFLRKLSLDELPQLWNVVLGDMSLVGPRPLPVEQVAANADFLAPRHEVRAGMTGWWQISGRSDLETEDALRQDVFYIENWSFSLDFYILLRTLGTVVGTKGAC